MDIENIKAEFIRYVDDYFENKDISAVYVNLKEDHSFRVASIMEKLARDMKLNEDEIKLSYVLGLLHDIGRFRQKLIETKNPKLKLDHADEGVKILFEEGFINKLNIPNIYHNIIKYAVKNHNKYKIEDKLSDKELFFAKLIRDADKIDIFRVSFIYHPSKIVENKFDKNLLKDFYNSKNIKLNKNKLDSSYILVTLSFIFDLNYKESITYLKELKFYEKYINTLRPTEDNTTQFKKVIDFSLESLYKL